MDIHIKIIPHEEQRYTTCGDWWIDEKGDLQIRASQLNYDAFDSMALCVAQHELTEALLCLHRGIPGEAVDQWDLICDAAEPGDVPDAPYHREHTAAYVPELHLLSEFGLSARDYEAALDRLYD